MRFTTAFLPLTLIACVGNVGNGPKGGRTAEPKDDDGDACEKVVDDFVVRTASDFDAAPDGCWDLHGTLRLEGASVTSLARLGELIAVNNLELVDTKLATVDMASFDVYGDITIVNNTELRDLRNVNIVRESTDPIPVDVLIDGNPQLVSLDGVAELVGIDGNLQISNNAKLTSAALRRLTTVDGSILVTNNAALTTLDVGSVSSVGTFEVANNGALTTFTGPNAVELDGNFTVRGNRSLRDLGSMSSLSRIKGHVTIDNNAALASLTLPPTLQYVTGTLSITTNSALTELGSQTPRLLGIGAINISNNTSLNFCEAHEVDHCVAQHGAVTISGNKQQSANNCVCWCQ